MRIIILIISLLWLFNASAQQVVTTPQFNTPFYEIANLSKDKQFRDRVGVAMFIKAGEVFKDTTLKEPILNFYEKSFAALIISEPWNDYYLSLFTNAAMSAGVKDTSPDPLLYTAIYSTWNDIFMTWMYRNNYIPKPVPSTE